MQIFHTSDTVLKINNREIPVKVSYAYECDSNPPDFDYGSTLENQKELTRFKSGELMNVCIQVTCEALNKKGSDYLGGCFVETSSWQTHLQQVACDYQMVEEALEELRTKILLDYQILKQALEEKSKVKHCDEGKE